MASIVICGKINGVTMVVVNALGKVCPVPIIMIKKALRENNGKDDVMIQVDNEISTQNLTKLATQLKLRSEVKKISNSEYEVTFFVKGMCDSCKPLDNPISQVNTEEYVVVISSETMGTGDTELGKKLLENFIYSLSEQDVLPSKVIFYNSGVKVVTQNEKSITDLKAIEQFGCEILSCGLCLDYYNVKDQLRVGSITNMYRILEIMRTSHVLTI